MSKKNTAGIPSVGLDLTGNIPRYAALLAREVIGALPNGGDYARGIVTVGLTLTVDMDEGVNLHNATKSVVVVDAKKDRP
jgi:hypothetical protein